MWLGLRSHLYSGKPMGMRPPEIYIKNAFNMQRNKTSEVVEDLLHGKLKIIQNKDGYRFSIDAILLANFVNAKKRAAIIDLGTGCGVIPIVLSWKNPDNDIKGVEIDSSAADMATRSVALNNLTDKIVIEPGDIKDLRSLYKAESFDIAVTNPPYGKPETGRLNPNSGKAVARHEINGTLDDFLSAAAYCVKFRGRLFIVYPAKRLADLMWGLKKRGFEPKRMRLVYSREGESARLVLVEGVKGGGADMEVLKPLYIYDNEGGYTKEIEEMYQ